MATSSLPALLMRVQSSMLSQYSDQQLLERFADNGDEAAFADIVDRHGPMLLGLCRRRLGDLQLAEDVLQATFLVLARKAASIRRRDSVGGWLYGVANRLACDAQLARSARSKREKRAAALQSQTAREGGWDDLLRVLDEELQRLPERYRSPLVLCYLEGRTQDEAAKQLGWSLICVRRRLQHGRDLLRGRMTLRGATLGATLFAGFLAPSPVRAALSAELRQSVLAVAKGLARPAVLALAHGALRMTTLSKLVLGSALALTALLCAVGIAALAASSARAVKPRADVLEPVQLSAKTPDLQGDALPAGAVARLGNLAFRHGRTLNMRGSLTFTADGKYLISEGGGWIRRWDVATGQSTVNLGEGWRSNRVDSVHVVSTDGKLASIIREVKPVAGKENAPGYKPTWECAEYDLQSGKERRVYQLDFIPTITWGTATYLSPNGKFCAQVQDDVIIWNTGTGANVHQLKAKVGNYNALAFTQDGKAIVVSDSEFKLHAFDLATGKEQQAFGVAKIKGVRDLAFSPNGKWLLTWGLGDSFIRLWDFEKGTEVRVFEYPEDGELRELTFTPDNRTVVAGLERARGSYIGVVRTWDAATGVPGMSWTGDLAMGSVIAVSPDSKTLVSMNISGVIRFFDMESGKERRAVEGSPITPLSISFRADSKALLTVGVDSVLREWDIAGGKVRSSRRIAQNATGMGLSPCGRFLFKQVDLESFQLEDALTGKLVMNGQGWRVVFSADGKRVATRSGGGLIRVWDTETGRFVKSWLPPEEKAQNRQLRPEPRGFTADGASLVLQGTTVSMWDVKTAKQATSWNLLGNLLVSNNEQIRSFDTKDVHVAVSHDGRVIAFGLALMRMLVPQRTRWLEYGNLRIWETATGKLVHDAEVADESFSQLTFSPDGKLVAAAGRRTIYVWEVGNAKALFRFEGHRGSARSLAFSPDGKQLASGSDDSTVLVWNLSR